MLYAIPCGQSGTRCTSYTDIHCLGVASFGQRVKRSPCRPGELAANQRQEGGAFKMWCLQFDHRSAQHPTYSHRVVMVVVVVVGMRTEMVFHPIPGSAKRQTYRPCPHSPTEICLFFFRSCDFELNCTTCKLQNSGQNEASKKKDIRRPRGPGVPGAGLPGSLETPTTRQNYIGGHPTALRDPGQPSVDESKLGSRSNSGK